MYTSSNVQAKSLDVKKSFDAEQKPRIPGYLHSLQSFTQFFLPCALLPTSRFKISQSRLEAEFLMYTRIRRLLAGTVWGFRNEATREL